MPSNRAYLNPDIIKPIKYIVPPTHIAKEPPLKPQELPKFEPYVIDDYNAHSKPNFLNYVNTSAPLKLFKLFFTDEIINKLVKWLNNYIKAYTPSNKDALIGKAYPQQPTFREKLYAYFKILIYIKITSKLAIKDYQGSLDSDGCLYIVKNYILKNCFQQLNYYFRATEPLPNNKNAFQSIFNYINKLFKHL